MNATRAVRRLQKATEWKLKQHVTAGTAHQPCTVASPRLQVTLDRRVHYPTSHPWCDVTPRSLAASGESRSRRGCVFRMSLATSSSMSTEKTGQSKLSCND